MAAVGGGVKGMKSVLSSRDAKESQCSARHVSLSALFRLFVIATCLKLLLVPSYHSTDFEVHRNWLAVTHSLPINQWYVDETSPWTLDYPPFFAWFERLLSVPASHVEPKMVHLKEGLNHASDRAVLFQRATVMAADIILFASVYYFLRGGQQWSWTAQRDRLLGFAILLSPGLMIVDHIHFQYNGMLMGMLIFSLSMMERGDRDLQGAVVFAILVCFKHLFAVAGPLYAVYLLRHYCGGNVGKAMGSFVKLGGSVLGVVAVAFGPFVLHGQVQQVLRRLFPFGRGLCHAYWAPNAWAIYNVADKALTVLLPMVGIPVSKQHASMTGGLVGDSAGHVVLPQIRPPMAMVLTLVAMVPCLVRAWRHPRPREFIRLVVYANLCGFMFGWHVHEKAALTFVVPFSLISTNSAEEAGEFLFLSTVSQYSLFPLLFDAAEYPIKLLMLLIHSCGMWLLYWRHFAGKHAADMGEESVEANVPKENAAAKAGLGNPDGRLLRPKRQISDVRHPGVFRRGSIFPLLPFLTPYESLYLLGLVPLEVYGTVLHPLLLGKRLPFLPLMLCSVYCSLGITYAWGKQLVHIIWSNDSKHKIE